MGLVRTLIDIILHLDQHLNEWITLFGSWIYGILFAIIFAETGLIVTPFLPGDSLLFALGALTATDNAFLKMHILVPVLIIAATFGDLVNYTVGRYMGMKLFQNPRSKIFRKEYLDKTHRFYEKHGGKTVIIARYIPIVRTFAPFVAGMAEMKFTRFISYSLAGTISWVLGFTTAGHFFGNLPTVKRNFHVVIVAIIMISLLPVVIEAWKARRSNASSTRLS